MLLPEEGYAIAWTDAIASTATHMKHSFVREKNSSADHTTIKVELDLDAMTEDDREQALETLRQAQALLSETSPALEGSNDEATAGTRTPNS